MAPAGGICVPPGTCSSSELNGLGVVAWPDVHSPGMWMVAGLNFTSGNILSLRLLRK